MYGTAVEHQQQTLWLSTNGQRPVGWCGHTQTMGCEFCHTYESRVLNSEWAAASMRDFTLGFPATTLDSETLCRYTDALLMRLSL